MAINLTLNSVVSGYNLSTINSNYDTIETALQDALSRSGGSPNFMSADLDMNGNQILNLPAPSDPNDPVRFQDVSGLSTGVAEAAASAVEADASADAAEASASGASSSAASALVSATNALGSERGVGWDYNDTTTMSDPGASMIRLDNVSLASVTSIAVSKDDYSSLDVSDYVAVWGDSTNTNKGTITVRKVNDSAFFAVYSITASVTDNTDWLEVTVSHVDSSGTLSDGDRLFLHFTRAGDQGASGAGSGDMVSTNNLSDVASASTSRSNLGLGALAVLGAVSGTEINNDAVDSQHYVAGSIDQEHLANDIIGPDELVDTAVTPGSYTNISATVDQQGRITAMSSGSIDVMRYSYQTSSGVNGQTVASGSWQTVFLNTEEYDTGSHGSLSSNLITLPAGTYLIDAGTSFTINGDYVSTIRHRIQNITDGTTELIGARGIGAVTYGGLGDGNHVNGAIILDDTKLIELQCFIGVGSMAAYSDNSGTQVHSYISITKVA